MTKPVSERVRPVLFLALFGAGVFLTVRCGLELFRPGVPAAPSVPAPEPTGDPYTDDVRHLGWLLRERYSWYAMRAEQGVDFAALEAEALDAVAGATDPRAFLRALRRFVAGIRDGHAHVRLEGVDLAEERRWPFSIIEVQEGFVVDGISPALFLSRELARGDTVLAVDGRDVADHVREQEAYVFASTPGARRLYACLRTGDSTTRETLRVRVHRLGEERPRTIELATADRSDPVPHGSWRSYEWKLEELDAETAYLCLGSFAARDPAWGTAEPPDRDRILAPQYEELARAVERVSRRKRLVLDLRGNPGGTDLLGQALARHLIAPGFRYYGLSSKAGGRWREPFWSRPEGERDGPTFRRPIACLIDERTFSVADNFAACLRDERPDVIFVGRPTGGGSGAPRPHVLPCTGAVVTFFTMRVWAPGGEPIEGNGVVPDVEVPRTRSELLDGTDRTLEAARAALEPR